jgi:hypothetical protein
VETVLFPKACYGFAMGLYTATHIADLQTTLQACIKRALRLHKSTHGTMLTLPREQNGVGIQDMADVYCKEAGDALHDAWRHTGRLGRLTRQVLLEHMRLAAGDLSVLTTRAANRQSLICRRITFLAKHGITPSSMAPTLADLKSGEAFALVAADASASDTTQPPPPSPAPPSAAAAQSGGAADAPPPGRNRILYIQPHVAASYESAQFTRLSRITATRTYRGKHAGAQGQTQHLCQWADSTMLGRQLKANKHLLKHAANREPAAQSAPTARTGAGRKRAQQLRIAASGASPAMLR